jgi:hypothetical protein
MIVVISETTGVDSLYEIPDVIWNRIIPLLPPPKKKKNNCYTSKEDSIFVV